MSLHSPENLLTWNRLPGTKPPWESCSSPNWKLSVTKLRACRSRTAASTSGLPLPDMRAQRSFSPPTWMSSPLGFHPPKTKPASYGRGACDAKGIIAAQIAAAERLHSQEYLSRPSLSLSAKNATAPEPRSPTSTLPVRNSSSTASLPTTASASPPRAHSASTSSPKAKWRTPLIPSSATPRSRNC